MSTADHRHGDSYFGLFCLIGRPDTAQGITVDLLEKEVIEIFDSLGIDDALEDSEEWKGGLNVLDGLNPYRHWRKEEDSSERGAINHMQSNSLADNLIALAHAGNPQRATSSLRPDTVSPLELFGMKMGSLRRKKGLSLAELEEATGIESPVLLKIEMGRASFEEIAENLTSVSKALGVDPGRISRYLAMLILNGGDD